MYVYLTLAITIGMVGYVFLYSKSYAASVALLICVSLWNIPVYMAGNSLSAGVFPVDFVILAVCFRHFVFGRKKFSTALRTRTFKVFLVVVVYVVFRAGFVLLFEDYGYYNRFIVYGVFRWLVFLLLFLLFLQRWTLPEIEKILSVLSRVLLVYCILSVTHQFGFVDLSASSATGHASLYEHDWLKSFVARTFLGNNSAVTASVCSFTVLLAIYYYSIGRKTGFVYALGLFGFAALSGTYSRTDVITFILILTLVGFVFNVRRFGKRVRKFLSLLVMSIAFLVFIYFSLGYDVSNVGLFSRYFGTDYTGQILRKTPGTLSYRIASWFAAISYLFNNPLGALFGFGANGYRMLLQNGVGQLNFGHNVLLHTVVELGMVGMMLLGIWGKTMVKVVLKARLHQDNRVRAFLVFFLLFIGQRLLSGVTIDTFFATDNAITSNVLILANCGFLVGLLLKPKSINENRKVLNCANYTGKMNNSSQLVK